MGGGGIGGGAIERDVAQGTPEGARGLLKAGETIRDAGGGGGGGANGGDFDSSSTVPIIDSMLRSRQKNKWNGI